ncbi:MAG: leucine-rich repeat protein [Mobilitalea sp.]
MEIKRKWLLVGLIFLSLTAIIGLPQYVKADTAVSTVEGIKFNYLYKGTTLQYEVVSPTSNADIGIEKVKVIGVKDKDIVYGNIEIPSTVTRLGKAYSVTEIGDSTFRNMYNLTGISIPNTISEIGSYAFYNCMDLSYIDMPMSVLSIGDYAFSNCYFLKSITIPDGVVSIGVRAFSNCSNLTELNLPLGLEVLGINAFIDTPLSETIIIPEDVKITCISEKFSYKTSRFVFDYQILSDADGEIKGKVALLDHSFASTLSGSVVLPSVVSFNGQEYQVVSIPDEFFAGYANLQNVVLPEGITKVGDKMFYNCIKLTSVTIPKNVTYIGSFAFYNCNSLTKIVLPEGLTEISDYLFYRNFNLTSVNIPNGVKTIGENAFRDTKITKIVIPNGVTTIKGQAFNGCSYLTSLSLPDSLVNLGSFVFANCSRLISIKLPKNMKTIPGGTFAGTSLKNISLPDTVTFIGASAFFECTKLESINLPKGLTKIEGMAFENCSKLKYLKLPEKLKSVGVSTFNKTNILFSVYKNSYAAKYLKGEALRYKYVTEVTSSKIGLDDILIKEQRVRIEPGMKQTLNVLFYPDNTTVNKKTTWTSSNKKVATIDSKGKITAITGGTTKITALVGNKKATCTIMVSPTVPKSLKAAVSGYHSIKLTWGSVTGATGYQIYRADRKTDSYTKIASVKGLSYLDTTANYNHTYYYKIYANYFYDGWESGSPYSSIVSAKPILK